MTGLQIDFAFGRPIYFLKENHTDGYQRCSLCPRYDLACDRPDRRQPRRYPGQTPAIGIGLLTNIGLGCAGAVVGGALFTAFKLLPGLDAIVISLRDVVAAFIGSLVVLAAVWLWNARSGGDPHHRRLAKR